ncbi:Cytochrome P450, E-class, group I [Plasmopara halstedii]|uniref:Cytochrome P450, E-class, group I n=1 Tax=Plasmopara halstedii TaxID=4781 RepID=A0A0N7L6K5_PLAHL|nr:Cytochrome P450, E-class, group I [Plasmopara halstedii]CEG44531.1 Cytochrome P450, E-class, group I [Plasmopara halstedii]|eukprot:XP_024580900.1 Cytochrome P450, E-class, group I [Plasmopara halstedii]
MKLETLAVWMSPVSVAMSSLAVLLVYLAIPSAHDRAVKHLPAPEKDYPILGHTLEILKAQKSRKSLDWVLKYCRKFQGKPWRFRIFGRHSTIVVCSPQIFEDVQKTQFDAFDKSPRVSEAMYDVLGQGIFAISGPLWQHQRKTASHLFTTQMVQYAMEEVVPKKLEMLMKRLNEICAGEEKSSKVVDMKRMMNMYTMDVFAQVGFDVDVQSVESGQNAELMESLDRISRRVLERIQQPAWVWKLQRWLNVGAEKHLAKDVKLVDNLVFGVISRSIETKKQQEAKTSSRKDLISLFIEKSEIEYTKGVHTQNDVKLMRDFVLSFLVAGRETTATAMSWVILMFNRYPNVLKRVRQELVDKFPDLTSDNLHVLNLENLCQLVYLEAVVRETLRLFPVAPVSGRSTTRDVWLCEGTFVKAGTRVIMPHYAMGRMSTVWGPDVEEFKPERWIEPISGKIKIVSPFKFSVFLGGPRICLGMKFALAEIKLTLAKLVSKFEFRTVKDPFDFTYCSTITLQIKGPVDVIVSRIESKLIS